MVGLQDSDVFRGEVIPKSWMELVPFFLLMVFAIGLTIWIAKRFAGWRRVLAVVALATEAGMLVLAMVS